MQTQGSSIIQNSKFFKRSITVLFAAIILALVAVLCSCTTNTAKSTVTIDLTSHGATGYAWEYVASPQDVLKETSHDTKASTNVAGGDIVDTFVFSAQKPTGSEEVTLTFSLKRPWENAEDNENPETVEYVFKIDEEKNVTLSSKGGTAANIPEPTIS